MALALWADEWRASFVVPRRTMNWRTHRVEEASWKAGEGACFETLPLTKVWGTGVLHDQKYEQRLGLRAAAEGFSFVGRGGLRQREA